MKRVLAISSGGGHWAEMRRLLPVFEGMNVTFASVRPEYADDVAGHPYFSFSDFSRFSTAGLPRSATQIIGIVRKVRPQVVISTGSAPTLVALAAARVLFGARTIWIDSIANVDQLSTSGRLARYVAHDWLTQWEHLATPKGPRWLGAVL